MGTVNGYRGMPCAATIKLTAVLTGLVLAGGRSSRMGEDKAGLTLQGETLLCRAHRLLGTTGCTKVFLSGRARPEWPGGDPFVIPDLITDAGPVAALCSALQALGPTAQETPSGDILLVCAVDTPLLTPALFAPLVETLTTQTGLDAACFQKHPIPLALRLNPAVLAQAQAALPTLRAGQSLAIRQFLGELQTARLPTTPALEHQLSNINTPEEWAWVKTQLEAHTA